jgi:TRAP transporter TAXI family solute receptor
MTKRGAGLGAFGTACAVAFIAAATSLTAVNSWAQRIAFSIATGPSSGTYFPVGQTIAGIISHPPGVDRCSRAAVCGPEGLIASAQTSPGSYANVVAVNSGRMDSALAQSDIVAQAMAGKGAFKKAQTHIRVIGALFPEDVHVVAATAAHIRTMTDLRGKRVSIGAINSGTAVTARVILSAYRLLPSRVRASNDPPDLAAQKLLTGKIDAFFFVGGAPVPLVQGLIDGGHAKLVSIDGAVRDRVIARTPGLARDVIPATAYGGSAKVETLGGEALWIVGDRVPNDVVYALTRALFSPANRGALQDGPRSAQLISLDKATANLPAPLHPGAQRFYVDAKKLSKTFTTKPL